MKPDLECVLAFCNAVRTTLDRKPVEKLRKGLPGEPRRCAIANTINYGCRNRVWVDAADVDWGEEPPEGELNHIADTPGCATTFIRAFDQGALPQFVGEGWVS